MAQPKREPPQPLAGGCTYIVGYSGTGTYHRPIFCNKLTADGLRHCPKHVLFLEDEAQSKSRAAKKSAATRLWKQQQQVALSQSPLRANSNAKEVSKPVRMDA